MTPKRKKQQPAAPPRPLSTLRPHERLIKGDLFGTGARGDPMDPGDRDTILALRTLYIWQREGRRGLPPRDEIVPLVGSKKTTEPQLRKVVQALGKRLGMELIEQSRSPASFWRLTELGVELGVRSRKILAMLDKELDEVMMAQLCAAELEEAQLRAVPLRAPEFFEELGAFLGVELIETGRPLGGWHFTKAGARLAAASPLLVATLDEELNDLEEALRRDLRLRRHIHIGCFNAQVRLYLAKALGSLLSKEEFGYRIRFNRDMNMRTVNTRVILDDVGRDQGSKDEDPGLYRYRGFHYGVVPWISGPHPYGVYEEGSPDNLLYGGYTHDPLYEWKLLVVGPEGTMWNDPATVTMEEVLEKCEELQLPLLLTPPYNVSRQMVDIAFAGHSRVPLVDFIIENPDAYTRFAMAHNGHGIAVVTADTMPPSDMLPLTDSGEPQRYPHVVLNGQALCGFHTLSWKPGRDAGEDGVEADGADQNGAGQDEEVEDPEQRRRRPPSGVTRVAHQLLRDAVKAEVATFVAGRLDVDLPSLPSPPSPPPAAQARKG